MKLSQFTEAMPGRFAKSDDTKRAERNAKRRDQRSAERDAEKSKNDKLLDKYWRVFTDMAAQTYPDADPIDACFQKYRDFDMDKLNAAAKKHGYNDPMDYWDELGDLPMEGEQHGNSKIYDKCWDGYKKVPGKKRGEKGSCVKEDESMNEMEQLRKLAGLAEADDDTCTACSGKGHKPASGDMDRDCEKCDGTGKVKKVAEASDCDETCPKSCPDCGGTGKPKKDKVDESYPMAPYGQDTDTTEVSYNVNKKIGDAHLNINARAKSMDELKKVLQMAGLDPDGAEQHMPEPDSVKVVSVDPAPAPCDSCGDDAKYSTDKKALVDMLRNKLQSRLG